MNCDVTKVTYNMYSYVISGMSRERMEMEVRDSAKYRKSKLGDIDGIIEFVLNDNNAKIVNSVISYKLKRTKNEERRRIGCSSSDLLFLVREHPTSL